MLYVDDRSWAAPTARQCALIGRQWREWSAILGLKENETKDQYHHRTVRGRRQLLAVGVEGDKITPWPKILGITLVPAVGRKTRGTESDRLNAAAWVLKRVRCLPVPFATRVRVAGVSGVSKAAFGWMCRLPTLREVRTFDWKVAMSCRAARQADPSLRRILLGHHASLGFRTACDQVMALWRCVKNGDALPKRHSMWAKVIYKSMSRLGWSTSAAGWSWHNDVANVSLDVNQVGYVHVADKLAHLLRESWRRSLFRAWTLRGRTDSRACHGVAYNEQQCAHARRLAVTSRNAFTVLSGAAYSWARRRKPTEDRTCPLCHAAVGSWEHLAWACPTNVPPCSRPLCSLQARLGWGDQGVFDHLAATRLKILPFTRALSRAEASSANDTDHG